MRGHNRDLIKITLTTAYRTGWEGLRVVEGEHTEGLCNRSGDRGPCRRVGGTWTCCSELRVPAGHRGRGRTGETSWGKGAEWKAAQKLPHSGGPLRVDKELARAWEQSVLSSKWPPVMEKEKTCYLLNLATKRMVYEKGVTGFLGKRSSREAGVRTGLRVLRSVCRWPSQWHVGPASKDMSPAGAESEEIRRELHGNASRAVPGALFGFFPEDERYFEYV